ncbi:MAG: Gfo/Idh/MocA family oxidoreductase [Candidatus Lokiarchaeota archaeon]|nr:Gfo/Idh/MocA family oxidoreductase [Candidatus Lokiarchaeota archaeon]
MKLPIKAILIGAGNRGMTVYGQYALENKEKLRFVAVAEPISSRLEKFASLHDIPQELCFNTWETLLVKEKLADVAFICTQDQLHIEPTIMALERGYHILLEKPMAHTLDGCINIIKKVEETGNILGIGHVLRYTDFFSKIYHTIKQGLLGEIINISHRENVSWYHIAHSFVRGNWRKIEESSPMILAKCCHDLDILFWLVGSQPKKISSFGSLKHFKRENAPGGAPDFCVEGCPIENSCLYYAPRIYIEIEPILQILQHSQKKFYKFASNLLRNHPRSLKKLSKIIKSLKPLVNWKDWPVEPMYFGQPEESVQDYSNEARMAILKRSPYGRCVYKCDNDVVDHQIVNIEFENDVTASLTMHGFSDREGRTLRIDGTKATLIGEFGDSYQQILLRDHYSPSEETIFKMDLSSDSSGHGGGDYVLIEKYIDAILDPNNPQPLTNARESMESHLMAFAANESRLNGKVINIKNFREQAGYE